MRVPPLVLFFLFYLLAILQNSFFSHFPLFGVIPSLVFIAFYVFVFFEERGKYGAVAWYAFFAGLFLDIFSYHTIGLSILLFFLVGMSVKKLQDSLREAETARPLLHFAPLFLLAFLLYSIVSDLFASSLHAIWATVNWKLLVTLFSNLIFAILGFYAYRKLQTREV